MRTLNIAAVITIAALAACASPVDLRRDGDRHEVKLEEPPDRAARCVTVKFEGSNPWAQASYRRQPDGTFEVTGLEWGSIVLVGEIKLARQGSALTLWVARSSSFADGVNRDRLLSGC